VQHWHNFIGMLDSQAGCAESFGILNRIDGAKLYS
jgi:hypothetical protein